MIYTVENTLRKGEENTNGGILYTILLYASVRYTQREREGALSIYRFAHTRRLYG